MLQKECRTKKVHPDFRNIECTPPLLLFIISWPLLTFYCRHASCMVGVFGFSAPDYKEATTIGDPILHHYKSQIAQ